jgi:hypothetical protein
MGGASGLDPSDAGPAGSGQFDNGGAGGLPSVDSGTLPADAASAGAGIGSTPDTGADPTCSDGLQNQDETGLDCGGSVCAACPTCSDGLQNQGETGLDCGGSVCAACPTCSDGLQNQDETGLDCGGSVCAPCPSCSDGVQNQGETGLDCGGPICAACPSCSDGVQNQDETGLDCGGAICAACPTCSDGLRNQDETGVDCGGSSCAPCPCTFATPQVLGNPNGAGNSLWAPTLSSNALTMYVSFTASGGNEQIAVTTRASRGSTFSTPTLLPSPVNSFIEGTPELSADGLSLYFFSEGFSGPASRDLRVATRASTAVQFNTVQALTTINSSARDDRPWVSPDELTIYFSSQRASSSDDLWRATRTARSNAFGTPVSVTELNSSGNDAGIFLTSDGLVALFASDRTGGLGGVDIYRATRASTSSPFSTPQRLTAVNSSADDFDPQLTADSQELFFASTRGTGTYRIWRSTVTCP